MSANARTIPLPTTRAGVSVFGHEQARAERSPAVWVAVGALTVILTCCLLIVVMAADRPSFLSATTNSRFFPSWMAGPLGGLWPGPTRDPNTLKYVFTGMLVAMYVSYLVGMKYVVHLRASLVIAALVCVHAIMFLAPPMALTDIFNYVNYGRMEVVHHLNPYTTIPTLEPHNDPSFALSNWHHLLSPYGPMFTLLSFAVVPLGVAGSFWAFKVILMLSSLGIVALVYRCAQLLGRNPNQAIVFVGLNPIVLVWGLGGDHNDFIMVFFIMLGFYLLLRARIGAQDDEELQADPVVAREPLSSKVLGWLRPISAQHLAAGAAFTVAVFVKASAGVLIPVVIIGLWRSPRRLVGVVLGMGLASLVLGASSLLAFGPHLPDLSTQGRVVTNISLPNLLGLALGQGGETNTLRDLLSVALIGAVIACCALAYRRRESLTATGWATVALLVTLSWVLPWYVVWVLPMAALSGSRRLRTTTLVLGVYLILAWVPGASSVFSTIGFNPARTPLGQQHQRTVKELLN
jgi:hypothetical protein